MKLLQRIFNFIVCKIDKFVKWYYFNILVGDDPDQEPIEKLKWIPRKLDTNKYHLFGAADSIEFAIDRMPVQEEIVFEVDSIEQANKLINNLKEVEVTCQ